MGVENGCEIPGVDDDKAGGGSLGSVVGGGGCDGAAFGVDGTVATVREVLDEGIWGEKRESRLRRHEVQSMAAALLGDYAFQTALNSDTVSEAGS